MNPVTDQHRLLIVEDDAILAHSMQQAFTNRQFTCLIAASGSEAASLAGRQQFELIILDLALDDDSGLGVLSHLRQACSSAAIVVLTPLEFAQERKMAIQAGADEFAIKPASMRELVARTEAAVVRRRVGPANWLEVGPLQLDLSGRKLTREGVQIPLTPTEFRILEILMRNKSKVVTRRMLCEDLWSPDWEGVTNVIEVHINRLRGKIEQPGAARMIKTVRGSGYRLDWQQSNDLRLETVDAG